MVDILFDKIPSPPGFLMEFWLFVVKARAFSIQRYKQRNDGA